MSVVFEKPLLIEIKRSRQLNLLLLAIHGITMISIVVSAIPMAMKMGFGLLVIVSCIHYGKEINAISRIVMKKDNEWDLFFVNGEQCEARLIGSSYISYYLIILGFRLEQEAKNTYVCLMRDSIVESTSCRLRSALRVFAKHSVQK